MNDLSINWKRITKGMPQGRHAANDRVPDIEEIKKLMEFPDRRIKPIILTMISSGIRVGAWDTMKWKHIFPIKNDSNDVIAAKLIVYPGNHEEYFTFVTSEAYNTLEEWMNFRATCGEKITGESWIMRDTWQSTNIRYGHRLGIAAYPKQLTSNGIRSLVARAIWEQGIRTPLKTGERRHEWKALHGFRKWFKTQSERVMKSINVELLMGHTLGVSSSYYKPAEREILDDYLKAIDLLTLDNSHRLKREVDELKQKQDEIILIKLKHDEEMKQIKDQLQDFMSSVEVMDKKGKQEIAERMINKGFYVKKRYGNLTQVTKRIDYDIKHGVEKQEVLDFLELVKTDESYSDLRKVNDFGYKLDTLEGGFLNKESKANYTLPYVDF